MTQANRFTTREPTEDEAVAAMETIGDTPTPALYRDGEVIAVFTVFDFKFARRMAEVLNAEDAQLPEIGVSPDDD